MEDKLKTDEKKGQDMLDKIMKYQKMKPDWRVPKHILYKVIKLTRPYDPIKLDDIDPDKIPKMLEALVVKKEVPEMKAESKKVPLKMRKKKKKSLPPPREKHGRVDALLKNIYYDIRNPSSFSSPYKLYKAAKAQNQHIRVRDVTDWLAAQNAYTLYRPVKSTFQRRKVIVRGLAHQYQADLVDFQPLAKENSGTHFLLTIIDCFSRFALGIPIKSKSGASVVEGFKKAFKKMMPKPRKIQTDRGSEFYNANVTKYLRDNNIALFSTDQELKASIVERFNRTLREKIQKYMVFKRSLRYVDALPDILFAYNAAPHSSLKGKSPIQVTKRNEREIYDIQYGEYLKELEKKAPPHKYKIKDVVRVAKPKKGMMKMDRTFKEALYVITDTIKSIPPTYKVKKRSDGTIVDGAYYEPQLLRVNVGGDTVDEETKVYDDEVPVKKVMSKYYGGDKEDVSKRKRKSPIKRLQKKSPVAKTKSPHKPIKSLPKRAPVRKAPQKSPVRRSLRNAGIKRGRK